LLSAPRHDATNVHAYTTCREPGWNSSGHVCSMGGSYYDGRTQNDPELLVTHATTTFGFQHGAAELSFATKLLVRISWSWTTRTHSTTAADSSKAAHRIARTIANPFQTNRLNSSQRWRLPVGLIVAADGVSNGTRAIARPVPADKTDLCVTDGTTFELRRWDVTYIARTDRVSRADCRLHVHHVPM